MGHGCRHGHTPGEGGLTAVDTCRQSTFFFRVHVRFVSVCVVVCVSFVCVVCAFRLCVLCVRFVCVCAALRCSVWSQSLGTVVGLFVFSIFTMCAEKKCTTSVQKKRNTEQEN